MMSFSPRDRLLLPALLASALSAAMPMASVLAGWAITPRGTFSLASGSLTNVRELSGVTYLGPQPGGLERFAAIQDENRRVIVFDVAFAADGAMESAVAVQGVTLASGGSDYEGIVYTGNERNSVFVSEENTPTVREFRLDTGQLLQSVALPSVYGAARSNRGLESLTRSADGRKMWTANEEALVVDGPEATPSQGTVVRLQQLIDNEGSVSLGRQFAYLVDPIHGGNNAGNDRSGLVDMVLLPDDTLLALERSAAATLPPFRSRIYQVGFDGATDIRGTEFSNGLDGASFVSLNKSLLWSGAMGGLLDPNQNLEGLGLGPVLANGNWVLLGVLDNGGSGSNLIASFELSRTGCTLVGDYNCSGAVDGADYTLWKNMYGVTGIAAADGNADGRVDAGDYVVWRNALAAGGVGGLHGEPLAAPEPYCLALLLAAGLGKALAGRRRFAASRRERRAQSR